MYSPIQYSLIHIYAYVYIFRLLLGSVNHSLKFGTTSGVDCKPIPLEASCHIADHIQVRIHAQHGRVITQYLKNRVSTAN